MFLVAVWVVALATAAWGRYSEQNPANYEDMLVQDLYKRLSELSDPRLQGYYDSAGYGRPVWGLDNIALEARESGQADLRDHEYLEHSSFNDGFQYISGGAGEGEQHLKPAGTQQNTPEVKSDEALPFYCHPPNPCPKGFKGKDGCHEMIEDTAEFQQEWILKMQKKGMCDCDEEHMFRCPKSIQDNKVTAEEQSNYQLDKILDNLFEGQEKSQNPYINKQEKRKFLVAKKAPIVKRSYDNIDRILDEMQAKQKRNNPYLEVNQQIKRVAKKG